MRINVAVPEPYVSAPVLNAGLEAVTRLNEAMIRGGDTEPFDSDEPQARWKPEPPGEEHFDHGKMVMGRGWGDCDDLAPWHAASLRVTGEDPGARAIVRKSGPKRWHAIVRRSDGSIDDPSLDAGMPGPARAHGVMGACQPPMTSSSVVGTYIARPSLAIRPVLDRTSNNIEAWQARSDLPWHSPIGTSPTEVAMVSLHTSPVPDQALVGSLEGLIVLGEESDADAEHLDRLRAISDMLAGYSWEDCADEYGPHHADAAGAVVGKLFGKRWRRKMGRRLKKMARGAGRAARGITRDVVLPLAPLAAKAIPGAGPGVSVALQAASPQLQKMLASKRHISPAARFARGLIQRGASMAPGGGMPGLSIPSSMPSMSATVPGMPAAASQFPFAAWF